MHNNDDEDTIQARSDAIGRTFVLSLGLRGEANNEGDAVRDRDVAIGGLMLLQLSRGKGTRRRRRSQEWLE